MATLIEARASWVQENPIASISPQVNETEYEALADDRAVIMLETMTDEEEQDARRQLAEQVRTALDLLDNGATLAQTRTILARLIRYLVRTGVIGP